MSLPMTTRCGRPPPLENSLPAAMPTLSATSEVIGTLLASPRMPSVPKYLRAMGSLVGPAAGCDVARMRDVGLQKQRPASAHRLCRAAMTRPNIKSGKQRLHQFAAAGRSQSAFIARSLRRADRRRQPVSGWHASLAARVYVPILPRAASHTARAWRVAATSCTRRICTPWAAPSSAAASEPGRRSSGAAPRQLADEALARGAEQHGAAQAVEDGQGPEQRQVVGQRLAEADAGIDDQALARDAGPLAGLDARLERSRRRRAPHRRSAGCAAWCGDRPAHA